MKPVFYFVPLNGRLQEKGIKTIVLSGDREEAVATIAKTVGIERELINASLTPQEKSAIIKSLQAAGHRVAMVTFFDQIVVPSMIIFKQELPNMLMQTVACVEEPLLQLSFE